MSKKGFTYTLQIDAEINDLIAKTNIVKKSMESIMSAGKAPGAEKIFGSIERAIERLQQKAAQPIESVAAFSALEKDAAAVGVQLKKLGSVVESLGNMSVADKMDLLPTDLKKQIEDVSAALVTFSKAQAQAAQKTQALIDAENGLAAAQKELKRAEGRVQEKRALIQAQQALVDGAHDEADAIKAKIDALKKYQATSAAYEAAGGDKRKAGGGKEELVGLNLPADRMAAKKVAPRLDLGNAQAVADEITRLGDAYSQASKAVTDAESTQRRYSKQLNEANNAAAVASSKVTALQQSVTQLNQEFEKDKAKNVQAAYTKLRTEAGKLGVDLSNIPVDYTEQNFIELNNAMNQLAADGIANIDAGLNTIQNEMEETGVSADTLGNKMAGASRDVQTLDTQVSQTTAFTQRIAQFVGLEGGIEIARSAMRNAISTIKELDKAMTEMAVVTDLNVGDYWNQLPQHTEQANALGMSIKSVYEAETLYYQQGLKTNEVVAMSTETLKMARIAGLSAEDATNKMTAALRGFNMELNETSAQRIADVYSELAAITASDVDEISSAMTKTASIAASAGMEFETTAAFLSQIIETTRESAETAGTAMKTVIARFQELKKDPAEIGEVDGEIVDANKIETALRSVGVALRDSSGQFRELDEVFLELSSKWSDLDTNTQRYIATIAAGSRQQSRFIAMMSDYSRTQELVTAANTSAGASNEQFEKTMDSLESKLAELKNAWDSFTMGIMDSDILKTGIDLLTGLITAINNITDAFGQFSGAAKIGLLIAALYLGDKALKVFTTSIKEGNTIFQAFGKIGSTAASSIKKTMTDLTKAIKNTTKQEKQLNLVLQSTCGSSTKLAAAKEKVKKAQEQLNDLEKSGTATSSQLAAAKSNLATQEALLNIQQTANNKIRQESQAMVALGLSATQAEILALQGHTAAEVQNLITKEMSNGLSAEEARQRALSALGISSETGALTLNDLVRRNGILNFLTQLGLLILGKKSWKDITNAENQNTSSKLLNIIATLAQAAANGTLLATMWPILVATLAIAAAAVVLIGIVMLLVGAFKKAKANSPEGKLEAAKTAAEAAAEAADKAKEAYDGLADSFDSLSDKYTALEELTEGSREWRDVVKEINDEVLNLIDQYPELASLVTNENGVLTLDIESAEAQAVLDSYEDKTMKAQSAELAAKMRVAEKQVAVDNINLTNEARLGDEVGKDWARAGGRALGASTLGTEGTAGSAAIAYEVQRRDAEDAKNTKKMAEALYKGAIVQDENGKWEVKNQEILDEIGLSAEDAKRFGEELGDAAKELREYGQSVQEAKAANEAMMSAMALNATQMVNTSKMNAKEVQQVQVAANKDYADAFYDAELEHIKKLSGDEFQKEATKIAKAMYGESATVDKSGTVRYKDADNNEKIIERADFEAQMASYSSTEDMAKALENLPKAIDKVSSKLGATAGKAFENTFAAAEGGKLTAADVKELQKLSDQELKNIYNSLSEDEQKAFGSEENFLKHINEAEELAAKAMDDAREKIEDMGGKLELNSKMYADSAKGFADNLQHVMAVSGQSGVDAINNAVGEMGKNLEVEDYNKMLGAINAIDWQKTENWESLPETFEALGLSIPESELENFIELAKSVANAIETVDLEKLQEQMLSLQKIIKDIKSGEQGRAFSSEAYKQIVESNKDLADDFALNLEGEYVYLGNSMDTLTAAIDENTKALLDQEIERLQDVVDANNLMEKMAEENSTKDINEWRNWSDSTSANWLSTFKIRYKNQGGDLSSLGIEYLDNDTNIAKLSAEQIDEVLEALAKQYNSKEQTKENLKNNTVDSLSLGYQNQDMTINSRAIEGYRNKLANGGTLSIKQQNEYEGLQRAMVAQAAGAGVNATDLAKYTGALKQMKEMERLGQTSSAAYKDLVKQVREYENTIVNIGNNNTMRANLQGTMEQLSELQKQYKQTTEEMAKQELVAQMVANFGIEVTDDNYEELAASVEKMISGGEDAIIGRNELLLKSAQAAGVSLIELTKEQEQMSAETIAFFNKLEAIGIGAWEEMENGAIKFSLAINEALNDAATTAGTALEAWENPYDELYNLNHKLNAQIREREKLERDYERAVKDSGKSAQDLADITAQELASLKEEAKVQKDIAQAALKNIEMERAANTQYSRYYTYDAKTNTIQVNWEAVDKARWNADEGAEFEEFISYLEEQTDTAKEAQDALDDIEDSVDEIQKRGRNSTSEIYNQVKEGLIQERQEQIDKLQAINDAIQEAQSALVDQMQKQIDEARQARDNKKTENKIADKETRLAYLMRDTSGGNAMEIASLQKEIEEAKQGYTDSLIDQQLQSLQDANEHAAEQRQEQIDLAQAQLDSYTNSAEIWSEVKKLVDAGFQQVAQGVPFVETEAGKLAMIGEEVEAMNPFEAEDFATELNNAAKEGAIYQGFVKVTGEEGVTTIAGLATSITNDITTLKADSENAADKDTHSQEKEEPKDKSETVTVTPDENIDILLPLEKNASSTYTSSDYGAEPIVDSGGYSRLSIAGMEKKYNVILKAYAGGGLADQTGPAWLDGTKSRPEIVLNQTDSANFMQLRDILADILQGTSNLSGMEGKAKGGDNYFDIEINVESINDDYDVEQLADKIRDMIYEDSTYRNVNSISGLR